MRARACDAGRRFSIRYKDRTGSSEKQAARRVLPRELSTAAVRRQQAPRCQPARLDNGACQQQSKGLTPLSEHKTTTSSSDAQRTSIARAMALFSPQRNASDRTPRAPAGIIAEDPPERTTGLSAGEYRNRIGRIAPQTVSNLKRPSRFVQQYVLVYTGT